MVAVWILLGVLAAVVLLCSILLMAPIEVRFLLDEPQGFRILYWAFGKVYGEDAKKQSQKKKAKGQNPKKKSKPNPIVEGLKKALGLEHLGSFEKLKESLSRKGAEATLAETVGALWEILDRVFWIIKRCRITRCKIAARCGGEDAPLDYGTACAVVYPLVSYLESAVGLPPKAEELIIRCEEDRQETALELEIFIRARIWHILRALMHIALKNAEKQGENK